MKRKPKRRRAIHRDGRRRIVIEQRSGKGYDVEMIRDFLDQLLLELRTLQFENVTTLRKLEDSPNWNVTPTISEALVEQHAAFHRKYEAVLFPATVFDGEDATDYEKKVVAKAILQNLVEERDEQIGLLERLQPLFAEALRCAQMPSGINYGPMKEIKVREVIDGCDLEEKPLPSFESFVAKTPGHPCANRDFIETLQKAKVILVQKPGSDRKTPVFGLPELERIRESGKSTCESMLVQCPTQDDFLFLLAALRKFKGRHDYQGDPMRFEEELG